MHSGGIFAIAATAVFVVIGGGPGAAQQTARDQVPAFRSGIEVVTVDVGVIDRQGRPVRGLTADDFTVTVGGQPRHIVSADYLDRSGITAPAAFAPGEASISTNEGSDVGRLFVFIVDQSTLDVGGARRAATAAAPFLSRLTFADRSALMLMPLGPNVAFTWAHARVQEGLQRVTGLGRPAAGWEFGSLAEARDITNRNMFALRMVGERECGGASGSGFGSAASAGSSNVATPPAAPPSPGGGTPAGGETEGAPAAPAPAAPAPGGNSGNSRGGLGGFGTNACTRDVQMQAESVWRSAQMTSLASLSLLRQFFDMLGQVRGDKTVILISGGWPLDERDEISVLSAVASDAAAARATLYTVYVPTSSFSAERRLMTSTPVTDSYLHSGPLETLAAMTGGGSYRAEVGAEAVFERIGRELDGYYRLGIEKEPADADGKGRRLRIQVPRSGVTVRAREIFDVPTYEDRDWAARLASAIDGPVPATDLGLRVTSYLASAPDDASRLRLVVSGEADRAQPGNATLHVMVSDLKGKKVTAGEATLSHAGGPTLPFSTNVDVPPGSYIVRIGVIDSAGRVGSVDHRIEARETPLGGLAATGPILVRVPDAAVGDAGVAIGGVRQDERLALQLGLSGDGARLDSAAVDFEIAAGADGPTLLRSGAALAKGPHDGSLLAQGVADMRVLPPGAYVVRAKVSAGTEVLGEMRRGFTVIGTARTAGAGNLPAIAAGGEPRARAAAHFPVVAAPPFTIEQVLAPPVLGAFLDRVAARPDASSRTVRDLIDRARTAGPAALVVGDAGGDGAAVVAFLKGLTLLAQSQLEPAAGAFREAMRASADFYPAMIYLGACYAAGGKDKEAAGAWRTALIREGDTVALHLLLADAFLRQGRGDLAIDDLDAARRRWPDDLGVKRRFVMAALLAGRQPDALQALDELIAQQADDEPSLALALLMLYEAFETREPIQSVDQDRARMLQLAQVYRTRGGPALALVDTWVMAATGRQ